MHEELSFNPMPIIRGSFPQTVMGSIPYMNRGPKSTTQFIKLPDNDSLAIEVTTPKKWKKTDPTIVLIHGLCGSHKSPCLVRLAKKLKARNVRAIRVNLRGCGTGKGKAKRIYHGGQSGDIIEVLKVLKREAPGSDITLIGFSLGGNITLKLAGEISIAKLNLLKKAIAVNPPVDLYASIKLLGKPQNRVYERYFVKLLKEDINYRAQIFPEIKNINFPDNLSFHEFNKIYTVPEYGFSNVYEYYKKSSAKHLIPAITMECRILFSDDDPIIKPQNFDNFVIPKNVKLYRTKKGGHIGYISFPRKSRGLHWIDSVVLDWIFE